MPKAEWGTKRLCPTTGKRFFDLNKDPIVSPYTGEVVIIDSNTKSRVAVTEEPKKAPSPSKAAADDTDPVLEEDSDVDIDDDLLDDDDDEDSDDVSLDEIADVSSDEDES